MRNHELILRIVVVAFLIYSMTAFSGSFIKLQSSKKETILIQREVNELREENKALRAELSAETDDEKMGRLAREKLGMLKPGDKIFIFPKIERSCYGAGSR